MVVTKADIYEKVIFSERPVCPHCGQQMKVWECADTGLSCGSGWGTPYLFVCFNDKCPPFVTGWDTMKRDYGRTCCYRCICFPDSSTTEMMMVFSHVDCDSGLIDEAVIAADRARGTADDPAVKKLTADFECKDIRALFASLCDAKIHYKVRQKAAELIGELGLLETIEPLQNQVFKEPSILRKVQKAIKRIHEINRTRECPYCAEIIDAGVTKCSHCGRALSSIRKPAGT